MNIRYPIYEGVYRILTDKYPIGQSDGQYFGRSAVQSAIPRQKPATRTPPFPNHEFPFFFFLYLRR